MFEPKNDKTGHTVLVDFSSEYAENLPVTIPSIDAVGYIFAYTEEFRFDWMLAMYDGTYSRVELVRVAKKSDEDNFYIFRSLGEIPSDERERHAELDFELARQLREKVIRFELSDDLPRGDDLAPYVATQYWRNKIAAPHFCHAMLPLDEQHWLTEKILAVIGLPVDFDLNTLF